MALFFFSCRETLEAYSTEVKKLAIAVLGHMAKALKMQKEEMNFKKEDCTPPTSLGFVFDVVKV